jgi:hypothetical protein
MKGELHQIPSQGTDFMEPMTTANVTIPRNLIKDSCNARSSIGILPATGVLGDPARSAPLLMKVSYSHFGNRYLEPFVET